MLMDRILGVFRLDSNTFEAIEHDTNATSQAALVVAVAAIASALGAIISALFTSSGVVSAFLGALIWTFIGWILWALVTFIVGTGLFGGKADVGEMLRVIGFAYAPQVLAVIPCIGGLIGAIWSLAAGFIAIRQGLDLDNVKALLTVAVGFLVYIVGYAVIAAITGGLLNFLR